MAAVRFAFTMRRRVLSTRLPQLAAAFLGSFLLLACGDAGNNRPSPQQGSSAAAFATITPDELQQRLQASGAKPLVVDVREPSEYEEIHIDGARLAPLGNVEDDLRDVRKDQEIVLVCRSGNRSGKAARLLAARGYTRLHNLEGGMLAWEERGYPAVKK